jgi:YVTN family beta-propeller protein
MKSSLRWPTAAILLLISNWAAAQMTPSPSLLILSKHDRSLTIVDPATLKSVATIPVGNDPHEVVSSSDGKTAYVSNYGYGAYHSLAVVDLVAQKPLPAIELGALRGPHGLAFRDGKVWFTAEGARVIGSYDPATAKIDWIMGTGQDRTHMIYVFPGAKRILTTNVNSGTVTIFEEHELTPGAMPGAPPAGMSPTGTQPPQGPPGGMPPGNGNDWQLTVIPAGARGEGFDVSPDGKMAWVANPGDGTISVIDIANKSNVTNLAANVSGANRLKFTPDGKLALISAGLNLVIFDVAAQKEIKRLPIGHGSGGVLVQPDGARAFVACSPDSYVAVIDLKTLTVTGHIPTGGDPDGMNWAVRP